MSYPGNPELSAPAQERVIAAFRQVIAKLQEGQRDEAVIGLEFVLRLDPAFAPASNLHEQLSSGSSEIDLSALIGELQAPTTDAINELLVEAVDDFNNRDFLVAKEKMEKVLRELPGHREARDLLNQVTDALKVENQVGQFLTQAREALDGGDPQEAANFVMMAQALDPHYRGIDSMLHEIQGFGANGTSQAAQAPPAAAPATPPQPPEVQPVTPPQPPEVQPVTPPQPPEVQPVTPPQSPEVQPVVPPQPPEVQPVTPPPLEEAEAGFETVAFDASEFRADFEAAPETEEPADEAPVYSFEAETEDAEDLFEPEALPEEEASSAQAFEFGTSDSATDAKPVEELKSEEFSFGVDEQAAAVEPVDESTDDLFTTDSSDVSDLFDADAVGDSLFDDDSGPFSGSVNGKDVGSFLEQGQRAFDERDYQGAIDAWSKIYNLEPSNEEASRRIDEARQRLSEVDGRIQAMLADAAEAEQQGDIERALALAREALELQPGQIDALDMRQRLESSSPLAAATAVPPPPPPEDDLFQADDLDDPGYEEPLPELEVDVPESSPLEGKKARSKSAVPWRMVAVAIAAVVVILIGVFLGSRFLGTESGDNQIEALNQVLNHAETLYKNRQIDEAIHLLRQYEASDLDRERIERRIKKYEQAMAPPTPTPIPNALIEAEKLLDEGQWLAAYAMAVKGLESHPQDLGLVDIKQRVLDFEPQVATLHAALQKGDFRTASSIAVSLVERHPSQAEFIQQRLRSLFNAALAELRTHNLSAAEVYLRQLAGIDPSDEEVRRILLFIGRYKAKPVDMQLEIFIKSLKER